MKQMRKSDRSTKVVNEEQKAAEKVNSAGNILSGSSISSSLIERVWLLPDRKNPGRLVWGFELAPFSCSLSVSWQLRANPGQSVVSC